MSPFLEMTLQEQSASPMVAPAAREQAISNNRWMLAQWPDPLVSMKQCRKATPAPKLPAGSLGAPAAVRHNCPHPSWVDPREQTPRHCMRLSIWRPHPTYERGSGGKPHSLLRAGRGSHTGPSLPSLVLFMHTVVPLSPSRSGCPACRT